MLKKIDCVMVRVDDLDAAADFYTRVFGLMPVWRDESSIGLALPQSEAEVVLHTIDLPREYSVHYLVDDVDAAVAHHLEQGGEVRTAPFDIAMGRCAVLADPCGNPVCLVDMTRGPRS
jgi:predicted enzyme related to lactoylglutathione lyase